MMLHSYEDLESIFYIPVFTIGGGLSSGLCHVTFVAICWQFTLNLLWLYFLTKTTLGVNGKE